jgi:hypothetical protein
MPAWVPEDWWKLDHGSDEFRLAYAACEAVAAAIESDAAQRDAKNACLPCSRKRWRMRWRTIASRSAYSLRLRLTGGCCGSG